MLSFSIPAALSRGHTFRSPGSTDLLHDPGPLPGFRDPRKGSRASFEWPGRVFLSKFSRLLDPHLSSCSFSPGAVEFPGFYDVVYRNTHTHKSVHVSADLVISGETSTFYRSGIHSLS
jgi:hypothetical protein